MVEKEKKESYVKLKIGDVEVIVSDEKETNLKEVDKIAVKNFNKLLTLRDKMLNADSKRSGGNPLTK